MGRVNPNRLRAGACAWLLTLQFFVVETIVAVRIPGYSRATDTISALGGLASPAHRLMNASFVLQGVLILAGALLLGPALRGRAARVAPALLSAAAVGVVLVGIFPLDGYTGVHAAGAVLHLVGAGVGLLALAYGLRPHSETLGTAVVLLGLVGTAMTVFFLVGVTEILGRGGTERAAAYVLPIALALSGAALWRLGVPAEAADGADAGAIGAAPAGGLNRMQARELARRQERELRAQRNAERDAALEAAAERAASSGLRGQVAEQPLATAAADLDSASDSDPDLDPDDPWATPGRRRRD
jgi:hypothetical membrane protein